MTFRLPSVTGKLGADRRTARQSDGFNLLTNVYKPTGTIRVDGADTIA